MPRGGKRQGTPGQAYGNRSDLNQPSGPVPAQTIKGQTYGEATQQLQAQQAIPVAGPPQPTPPPPAFAQGGVPAGGMGDLLGPDDRPDEPVTAGAASGPGPGPEALGFTDPALDATRRDFQAMQAYVPTFMFHATRPGASPSYVAWVQRLLTGG